MKQDSQIKAMATHYLEGYATQAEAAALLQYIHGSSDNMRQFRLWEDEWAMAGGSHSEATDAAWHDMEKAMKGCGHAAMEEN